MTKATIEADITDIETKTVSKGAGGKMGMVYVPKAWIGKTVHIVLTDGERK
jgi:putative transposon-encoded protein